MVRKKRHCERSEAIQSHKLTLYGLLRRLCLLAMTGVVMTLTACGFHPVYGVNKYTPVGAEEKLAQIDIGNIPDREGQYLRNALIDRFYRDGRPVNPQYTLRISRVTETLRDLDITKTADTTRGQLKLNTQMTLTNSQTKEVLVQRSLQSITSYNILGSEFATRVAEDNTRLNALDDLARQIEQQLALYFKRN